MSEAESKCAGDVKTASITGTNLENIESKD